MTYKRRAGKELVELFSDSFSFVGRKKKKRRGRRELVKER